MLSEYERNLGLWERTTPRVSEKLMRRLGFIEVLPNEKEYLNEIRATSWAVRTALRLGPDRREIVAPSIDPSSVDLVRGEQFKEYLRHTMLLGKLGDEFDFTGLFPEVSPAVVRGVIRRIVDFPHSPEFKYNLFLNDNRYFAWAYQVMKEGLETDEESDSRPSLLIVAHTGETEKQYAQHGNYIDGQGIRSAVVSTTVGVAQFLSDTPYPGLPILKAEAQETGKIGKIIVRDYRELAERDFKTDAGIIFVAGACSFDVIHLRSLTNACKAANNDVLVGGLAATIDPEVIIQAVPKAHIFIGEVEGAMDTIMELLGQPHDGKRFVFHRGIPNGVSTNKKYLLVDDETKQLTNVYLNISKYVNINEYYSAAREKSGRLARRLKCQAETPSTFCLSGHEWEGPGPVGAINQSNETYGCPAGCAFCSTVESLGGKMRRKSLETIELELQAMEGQLLWLGDQNFGGQSENDEIWSQWMNGFFDLMIKYDKRLACQLQLSFFEKVTKNPELAAKVKKIMAAALVGLEQPKQVKGGTGKDPHEYEANMRRARAEKVIIFGTCVYGFSDISVAEFNEFLDRIEPDILAVFPFIELPGSPGVPKTEPNDPDPLARYKHIKMIDPANVVSAISINSEFYKIPKIIKRALKLLARGYSAKRVSVMLLTQIGAGQYITNRFNSSVENAKK